MVSRVVDGEWDLSDDLADFEVSRCIESRVAADDEERLNRTRILDERPKSSELRSLPAGPVP